MSTSWQWRSITVPHLAAGPTAGAAGAAWSDGLHLFVGAADGAKHLVLTADGAVKSRHALPLTSVVGAAATDDGLLVTGGNAAGQPVAVLLDDPQPTPVDVPADPAGEAELTLWPVPVAGGQPRVVWACGRQPSTVWLVTIGGGGRRRSDLRSLAARKITTVPYAAQIAGAGVHLLVTAIPGGPQLLRLGDATVTPQAIPAGTAAPLLAGGLLLSPSVDGLNVLDLSSGFTHPVQLPDGVGGGFALTPAGTQQDVLVWGTGTGDPDSEGGRIGLLDRTGWRVDDAVPLPIPSPPVAMGWLADRVIVVGRSADALVAWQAQPARARVTSSSPGLRR